MANDIELIERVDPEEEQRAKREEKVLRIKALAFRRLQVQIKIEEFLKSYTRGQNLVKINARGKRYARRVYVDTAKRALVIQGANGPKIFPFAAMKEVDLETRTTKEGRVETLLICAIEKEGRIVKELTLAFPDQAKASTFVNCVTLFSLALRRTQSDWAEDLPPTTSWEFPWLQIFRRSCSIWMELDFTSAPLPKGRQMHRNSRDVLTKDSLRKSEKP